ncbi:hypothetical protein [Streptomyces genisteinicus]|uniref:hypothetical protein n=1 Tax=Streptomyces genisteinicus TaxID=2768068 RepID=UPI001FE88E5D|nr:hypothetical protein [Streptomyces genisteinicus]
MCARSLALRTAGLVAVLVLGPAAGAAADDGGGAVRLTPSAAAAGDDVRIAADGCPGGTAVARSDAFAADVRLAPRAAGAAGTAHVRPDARPGVFTVRLSCDGRPAATAELTVRPGNVRPVAAEPAVRAHASPVAPVRAGGGGAVAIAAPVAAVDPEDAGPSARQAVAGLVLAGVAAVVFAVRGARRRGRTRSD